MAFLFFLGLDQSNAFSVKLISTFHKSKSLYFFCVFDLVTTLPLLINFFFSRKKSMKALESVTNYNINIQK